ncbi:MAG: serpin family protein [Deltaproteobacteria bacterium]|nr:serpin family protein [Deltaproteobacteria bacterium]
MKTKLGNGLRRALALVAGTLLLAACGEQLLADFGELIKSDKARITAPKVSTTDAQMLAQGNGEFALTLYQRLVAGEKPDFFFSPYSMSSALAMLYGGARGNTEAQIAQTMRFQLPQAQLHPAFNALDLALKSRGQGKKAADGQPFRLNVVNATWGQKGFAFEQSYLDLLAQNYGAGLRLLDFEAAPDGSRKVVNDWVAQQTEQRIKDLMPPGSIDSATKMVLTNAIYFNAAWAEPFDPKKTQDDDFNALDGSKVRLKMMHGSLRADFVRGADFSAAALPYDGKELSMLLIVPDAGKLSAVEQRLSWQMLDNDIVAKMTDSLVALTLPRFRLESQIDLRSQLIAMGMTDVMDSSTSDLSGIDGIKNHLAVTAVVHKAFVDVSEEGTEAAAATGISVGVTSAPSPQTLKVDRPFIFLIRDNQSKSILFIGRMAQPQP